MKRSVIVAAALLLFSSTAMADSIAGKIGVTASGGFSITADSKFTSGAGLPAGVSNKIETDTGYVVGGGLIYGINDNVSADLDITFSKADANFLGIKFAEFETTNISLGLQYHFMSKEKLVPYLGAGVDLMFNDAKPAGIAAGGENLDVDNTFGGHINAGVDYFITKQIALNAELKGILSTEGDIKDSTGVVGAKADPSSVSGLFGIRYFFN
jgi:outer membrane protein